MAVLKSILFFTLLKCVLSDPVSLVDPCGYRDIECLSRATEKFLENTRAGVPESGIKPIDPLFIPELQYADPGSDIVFHFKNITVTGLKNLKISDFQMDKEAKTVVLKTQINADIVADLSVELTEASKFLSGVFNAKASGITSANYNYELIPNAEGVEYFHLGPETITCESVGAPEITLDPKFTETISNDPDATSRRESYVKRSAEVRKETICKILKQAYATVIYNLRIAATILPKTAFFTDI